MKNSRTLLYGALAIAAAGLAVPLSRAAVGDVSPPVGVGAYALGAHGFCANWQEGADFWNSTTVSVCASSDSYYVVDSAAGTRNLSGNTAYVEIDQCANGSCEYQQHFANIKSSALSFDPTMGSASLKATVEGCPVDVTVAATGAPNPNGDVYHRSSSGTTVTVGGGAQEFAYREAAGSGSACGLTLGSNDADFGSIFEAALGEIDVAVSTG